MATQKTPIEDVREALEALRLARKHHAESTVELDRAKRAEASTRALLNAAQMDLDGTLARLRMEMGAAGTVWAPSEKAVPAGRLDFVKVEVVGGGGRRQVGPERNQDTSGPLK